MRRDGSFAGLIEKPCATLDEAFDRYDMRRPTSMRPLSYPDKNGEMILSPFHMQTVDDLTDHPHGVVSNNYCLLPIPEAFNFGHPLVDNGAKIVSGGAPDYGRTAYLVLENPGSIKVGNHEILNRYVLRTSHDGSSKIEIRCTPYFTATRVALTIDTTHPLSFKHTRNVRDRLNRARLTFKRVNESWNEFTVGIQKMIALTINEKDAKAFIEQVTPSASDSTRINNIREDIFTLFKLTGQARTIPQCRGTLFGLVMAAAEWADFHRVTRKTKKRSDEAAMLDARLVNDAAKKKQKAWAFALWSVNNQGKLAGARRVQASAAFS